MAASIREQLRQILAAGNVDALSLLITERRADTISDMNFAVSQHQLLWIDLLCCRNFMQMLPKRTLSDGHKKCLELLVEHGADVNTAEIILGSTALHAACSVRNLDAVVELLKLGANPNVQNRNGMTPLYYLTYSFSSEGAELPQPDPNGQNGLCVDEGILFALLNAGADATILTSTGKPIKFKDHREYLNDYLIGGGGGTKGAGLRPEPCYK